jgi:alginate O-acetyltransferase complex protein AlgI
MLFTSLRFLGFLIVVLVVYYTLPIRYRVLFLLAASYFFYLTLEPLYGLLLFGITLSTYVFTRLINRSVVDRDKRIYLFINVGLILLPLFFYKYWSSMSAGVSQVFSFFSLPYPIPSIRYLLPVGISFYTFVAIGYTVDVYNEEVEAEENFSIVALFLSFFPLILSGPIERAKSMLPQFKAAADLQYANLSAGFKLMVWGYFMKLVVADRLSQYVDVVYGNVASHTGTTLLFTSLLYPLQVYADLGGYSLIAIGTARMLGYGVRDNFRRPFFATTMSEFWNRWHISLIKWLTDYIYTPLSFTFRKWGLRGIVIALMLTFLISGLWHGAALTFVVWGLMQGFFLSVEAITKKRRSQIEQQYNLNGRWWYIVLGCMITYVLFSTSQIVARSQDLTDAWFIFRKIVTQPGGLYVDFTSLFFSMLGVSILLMRDFIDEFAHDLSIIRLKHKIAFQYSFYLLITFMILMLGVFEGNKFIYFQF